MADDKLYVIKRTFTDLKTPSEITFNTATPATFTDLRAAKIEAKAVLFNEGYEKDFFPVYDTIDGAREWKHGDGVIVYAEGSSGEIFTVEVETIPNTENLEPDDDYRLRRPLHHVVQTTIHYNEDRSGSIRDSTIKGTHMTRDLAQAHALALLLDGNTKKEDFAEYDEYSDGTEGPFGPDVIVHVVKDGGENILVSVVSSYLM
ncbi:hypothetical protein BX600DRAFT_510902 [Xylariales sp. PMI_506]|nr:hypothetical protein BX600DRAFT_510902 [Xylariales sp. PMI_506]